MPTVELLLSLLLTFAATAQAVVLYTEPTISANDEPELVGSWVETFGTLGGPIDSRFGAAIGLNANIMAIGSPLHQSQGSVYTAVYQDQWVLVPPLLGDDEGDQFGAALDLGGKWMVVGAPKKNSVEESLSEFGAAYFFEYEETVQQWNQVGPIIRGDIDILAAGGEFGAAVSVASSTEDLLPHVAIGAPNHSADIDMFEVGRVYTFRGTGINRYALEEEPLLGKDSGDHFGSAIDINDDGTLFIAGAPGNGQKKGYVQIYEWNDTGWELDFEVEGSEVGEEFGASVKFLTDSVFAVGAPHFNDTYGRVLTYARKEDGLYAQTGEIQGGDGDLIGRFSSISGGLHGFRSEDLLGEKVPILTVAGGDGDINTYRYNVESNVWTEHIQVLETGLSDLVIIYSIVHGLMWGSSSMDEVSLLEFVPCDPLLDAGFQCVFGSSPAITEEPSTSFSPTTKPTSIPATNEPSSEIVTSPSSSSPTVVPSEESGMTSSPSNTPTGERGTASPTNSSSSHVTSAPTSSTTSQASSDETKSASAFFIKCVVALSLLFLILCH